MKKIEKYLHAFNEVSREHFNQQNWLVERYNFFNDFFKEENLEKAQWADFQELGEKLHCFVSMAIAKSKALGNPNHSIEHYRQAFNYLVRGTDPVNIRIKNLLNSKSEYYIRNFGEASISELIG
ncbi:MAG: EVE domain-containing protein, partial [Marinilabiliales bacterium]